MNLFSILLSICVYCITIIVTKIITRINDIREKGRYINAFQNTISHRYYHEKLSYQRKSRKFQKAVRTCFPVIGCTRAEKIWRKKRKMCITIPCPSKWMTVNRRGNIESRWRGNILARFPHRNAFLPTVFDQLCRDLSPYSFGLLMFNILHVHRTPNTYANVQGGTEILFDDVGQTLATVQKDVAFAIRPAV